MADSLMSSSTDTQKSSQAQADFYISGMSCGACSAGIERAISRKPYCEHIEVNLITQKAHIIYNANKTTLQEIFSHIAKMGYEPSLHNPKETQNTNEEFHQSLLAKFNALDSKFLPPKLRLSLAIIFSVVVLALSIVGMLGGHIVSLKVDCGIMLVGTLFVAHCGRNFYFKGFKALFAKNPTMDSLIAIGTSAAFAYSLKGVYEIFAFGAHKHLYFESVCVILCFVMIGKAIENASKEDAQKSANFLLQINQKKLLRLDSPNAQKSDYINATFTEVLSQDIAIGDIIKILPNDLITIDCEVVQGNGSVDESSINGESVPALKGNGSYIYSGSINVESVLFVRALKVGSQTMLHQIFTLIQNAQDSKAPIGILADKIAAIFVPVVILIALCAGDFWWIMRDFAFGLDIFIAVLVISCPCALGLATPMAFLHAKAKANKMGVFFKTASCLQALSSITHIVFDKTGTLSQGLEVKSTQSLIDSKEFLSIVYSLESQSTHIIAQALKDYAKEQGAQSLAVNNFSSIAGFGIKGEIKGKGYVLGNVECLKLDNPHISESSVAQFSDKECKLAVYLARDSKSGGEILGALYLVDLLRAEVVPTIDALKKESISIAMLSGDNEQSAKASAKILSINEVVANAKPDEKFSYVTKLNKEGAKVLMVGDGVNDAAALKAASVSAAYASGNDIAQNCADIILYNQNAKAILNAYHLSKATIINIKENLFWAFGYNVIFIPIACGVLGGFEIFLNPMFCAFAMSFSSITVVLNAARLKRFKIV